MQQGFERREIRKAQTGFLNAALCDLVKRAVAPRQYQPQARRLHGSPSAHERARLGCAVCDAVAITRSSEKAPAPRIIRNAVMASTSRWNSNPSPFCVPVQYMKNPKLLCTIAI